ncbi:hypothetical protein PVAP13_7NG382700 [Panicum virgatum]|uniref:Isoaspartyl peptidase/L-asparaginase 2 n=1 Tax=Panicum virgatum TaxID=38727 RepID=A0A8T0Q7J8_PANVG|nr:hypothetical protein PVAP13_7NG382700 [Panicum virgatum]
MARWAIAIHGGAGVDPNLPESRQDEAKRVLARCLQAGVDMLRAGASALDVVEAVVRELETDPFFNSGRGSALTRRGTVEMEASIMDGRGRRCGAVSGVSTVKNPVSLARRVMDKSPHSYLAFEGAEEFAREQGLETVDNSYFITEDNVGMLKLAKEAGSILFDYRIPLAGTDTCSALAGADNHKGMAIIRSTLARDVAAVMEYKGLPLQEAVDYCVKERLDEGFAGLIAVSSTGEVAYGFNCTGMFRGCATEDGFMEVGIWE